MEAKSFIYWLQGFFELSEPNKALTPEQVQTIKNHLKLVFLYEIDPSYTKDPIVQAIFQNIHDGKPAMEGITIDSKPPQKPLHGDANARC